MSSSKDVSNLHLFCDNVPESLDGYLHNEWLLLKPGMKIGSNSDYEYEIIAKLGAGGYSIVWLALGTGKKNNGHWYALKTMMANYGDASNEVNTILWFKQRGIPVVGCSDLNRTFIQSSKAKTTHLCLPMPQSGLPVREFIEKEDPPIEQRIVLAQNATNIMEKMHQVGYIMTDFSSSNLMIRLNEKVRNYGKATMLKAIGELESTPVQCKIRNGEGRFVDAELPKNVPKILYGPIPTSRLVKLIDDKLELEVIDAHQEIANLPYGYASPHFLRSKTSTFASNIFTLGCLLFEIFAGFLIFRNGDEKQVTESHNRYFSMTEDKQLEFLKRYAGHYDYLNPYQTERLAELCQAAFKNNASLQYIKQTLRLIKIGKPPTPSPTAATRPVNIPSGGLAQQIGSMSLSNYSESSLASSGSDFSTASTNVPHSSTADVSFTAPTPPTSYKRDSKKSRRSAKSKGRKNKRGGDKKVGNEETRSQHKTTTSSSKDKGKARAKSLAGSSSKKGGRNK